MLDVHINHQEERMRTTLTIDDDILAAVKELADRQNKSMGKVLSRLAREALESKAVPGSSRNGVLLLPRRPGSAPVTPELAKQLRDELAP
jgi:uncharacterized protein (DUF885 family)